MDPLEKKVKEFYQEKKREDERSTPDFETLWNNLEHAKATRQPRFLFRIAASIALVAAVLVYYFYSSDLREVRRISRINMDQPLPSQVLLDKSLGTGYIWNWKAPTDKLLENVNELTKTNKN